MYVILALIFLIPVVWFWTMVLVLIERTKFFARAQKRVRSAVHFAVLYLRALIQCRRIRGALTLARQWDWEETIGIRQTSFWG